MTTLDRRLFLKLFGAVGLAASSPRIALAAEPTQGRPIFVILRGGLDGLHAVVPHADPDYRRLRPTLADVLADGRAGRGREFEISAIAAADLLARADGPRIAVMESQDWDTHFGQDWRLAGLFQQLSAGLMALRRGLGIHWRDKAVVVVSEFGRTAAENGGHAWPLSTTSRGSRSPVSRRLTASRE